jgi:hypothetical protein
MAEGVLMIYKVLTCALLACAFATNASASVIANSGFFKITSNQVGSSADFGGPLFHVTGSFFDLPSLALPTGTALVNTNPATSLRMFGGTLTYGGNNYTLTNPNNGDSDVFWSASGPTITLGPTSGIYSGTFSAFGHLFERTPGDSFSPPLVSDTFSGVGRVDLDVMVQNVPGQTLYFVKSATYTFTPEPATWGMVGSALVVFGAVGRRRRTKESCNRANRPCVGNDAGAECPNQ